MHAQITPYYFAVARTLFLGSLLALSSCKSSESAGLSTSPPEQHAQVQISDQLEAKALVVALDRAERLVTLRREDGSLFDVQVGDGVRNFDQIAVGDKLRVQYQETLAATLRPAGVGAAPTEGVFAAGRAKPGAKPGAGLGRAISVCVRIESIDLENHIVVFSLSTGELHAHRIVTPEGREFVKKLRLGDTVQLEYAEALALSITEL